MITIAGPPGASLHDWKRPQGMASQYINRILAQPYRLVELIVHITHIMIAHQLVRLSTSGQRIGRH